MHQIDMLLQAFAGFSLLVFGQRFLGGIITREDVSQLYRLLHVLTHSRIRAYVTGLLSAFFLHSTLVPIVLVMTLVDKGGTSLSQGFAIMIGATCGVALLGWLPEIGFNLLAPAGFLVALLGLVFVKKGERPLYDAI